MYSGLIRQERSFQEKEEEENRNQGIFGESRIEGRKNHSKPTIPSHSTYAHAHHHLRRKKERREQESCKAKHRAAPHVPKTQIMDGLEDQAELEANELVQQIESIFRSVDEDVPNHPKQVEDATAAAAAADNDDAVNDNEHVLTIRHSLRDSIVVRVCDTLLQLMMTMNNMATTTTTTTTAPTPTATTRDHPPSIRTKHSVKIKRMVFQSGISSIGLQKLRELLNTMRDMHDNHTSNNTNNHNNNTNKSSTNYDQSDTNYLYTLSVDEMEFVCLQGPSIVGKVIKTCRTSRMVRRLILRNYQTPPRQNAAVADAFVFVTTNLPAFTTQPQADECAVILTVAVSAFYPLLNLLEGGTQKESDIEDEVDSKNEHETMPSTVVTQRNECLEYLELDNYPIGSKGIQVLAHIMTQKQCRSTVQCLHTLRLLDCNLRSDSAIFLGKMLRSPNTCNMRVLDLSYNPYNRHLFVGPPLTREMFYKNLIRRGLAYNITLLKLITETTRHRRNQHYEMTPDAAMSNPKVTKQIDINHFLYRIGVHVPIQGISHYKPMKEHGNERQGELQQQQQEQQKQEQQHDLQHPLSMTIPPSISSSATSLVSSITSTNMWCHCFAKVSSKPSALYLLLQSHICHTRGEAFTYYHVSHEQ